MKKAYLFAGTSIALWSTVATVSKLLLGSLNSYQVLCVSALLGSLFLFVFNLITGRLKQLGSFRGKDYLRIFLIGLPGTLLYYLFFYTGTSLMPASQAFIVNYLWPIMSVVFACVILKERLTARKWLAFGVSFLGVMLVVGGDLLRFDSGTLLGALCCVLGAVSYGVFTALNQKYTYDKPISMMLFYLTTFVITGCINWVSGASLALSGVQLLGLAWNGMFTMAVASTCWMLALENSSGKTANISNLAYITPFLSLVWIAVFLKEELKLFSLLGLAVIVLGIFIQLKDKQTTK